MDLVDRLLPSVTPRSDEVAVRRVGDDLVPDADVVMDRAFSVAAPPAEVWPWLEQLGKRRAGWYLPRRVERFVPRRRRAIRRLDPAYGGLRVGDVIPDYGGRDETFEVALIEPSRHLVYTSRRGRTYVSWAIVLDPGGRRHPGAPAAATGTGQARADRRAWVAGCSTRSPSPGWPPDCASGWPSSARTDTSATHTTAARRRSAPSTHTGRVVHDARLGRVHATAADCGATGPATSGLSRGRRSRRPGRHRRGPGGPRRPRRTPPGRR